MSSPRPNNEPAPRVAPQQSPSRVPALVSGIGLVVIGIVWLALFVTRMLAGGTGLSFWWELVSGLAFLLLGAARLRTARRAQSAASSRR